MDLSQEFSQVQGPDIEQLLSELTLEEKISLLAGQSTWRTKVIERLNIPNLKVSDGPSGARGEIFGEGVPAAFLPSGVCLGATWDVDLLGELGEIVAEETKSKSASVILSPTMCMHRHPLGGRNFESYSEDPFLTGKLGTAFVRGVQNQGIGATPKHFVGNDQETNRYKVNANIPPRALREVYLLPFQMVVRDANPWCMMSAYNLVNGYHSDMSKELLTDIPRNEWQWDGVFMSDWGGTNSSGESLEAGLDLEMPGPHARRAVDKILPLVANGKVHVDAIDRSANRMLKLLMRAGRFQDSSYHDEITLDNPKTKAKLRQAASAGIVLLKNENDVLPLSANQSTKTVALLGPNCKRVVAGGGGSAYIKAPYWTNVYDSMVSKLSNRSVNTVYAEGARVNRYLPVASVKEPDTGKIGAAVDWFASHDLNGKVVATTYIDDLYFISFGDTPPEITAETDFAFRVRCILTPEGSGRHKLSLASIGPSELRIDGELVISEPGRFEDKEDTFFTYGSKETIIERDMVAGQKYNITIDCHSHDRQNDPKVLPQMQPMEDKFQGSRLGFEEYDVRDRPREAADVAKTCDAAIVVVGRDKEWETEGIDIPQFELPGEQVRLIQEVAAVCSRTIVVVQAGTPVRMDPWINDVDGVLYCWYQGQELGNATADVICGDFNPSGRLPMTFPKRIEDTPAFSSWPGENKETYYSEGIYVGYRWWDLHQIAPLFPIGYGLSYSTFEISKSKLMTSSIVPNSRIWIEVQVQNVSGLDIPGRHTVIVWCSLISPSRLKRPVKQICGFAKTPAMKPGQSCTLEIDLDIHAFGVYDTERRTWIIDAKSQFQVLVGSNANDVQVSGNIDAPNEITWLLGI